MPRIQLTDDDWKTAVQTSTSAAASIRALGLHIAGGTYQQVYKKIRELQLDTSHWLGQASNKGKTRLPQLMDAVLMENSSYLGSTHKIKLRLLQANLLTDACYECGITHWQGRRLSLHLDHINGIKTDYRLQNLRLLCPNCHSLTDTYCGRNAKRTSRVLKPEKRCLDCGEVINRRNTRCALCSFQARSNVLQTARNCKIIWPPIETLTANVQSTSYLAVARTLGVSDNAVRKHIRKHSK